MPKVTCIHCGGAMKKSTATSGSCLAVIVALIIFIVGVCLLAFFPVGTIIGALMMLASLFMGGQRRKVMKCRGCGYIFERA